MSFISAYITGSRAKIRATPAPPARSMARVNTFLTPESSPAPNAVAVRPVVPMRRNPKSQNTTLSMTDPTAIAAR